MDFSSDSDYSDGSTGMSRGRFISSTPKRLMKTRRGCEARILSPVMPEAISRGVSREILNSDDKRSMICNGDIIRRRKPKFAKVVDLKNRYSVAVPAVREKVCFSPVLHKVQSVSNFTLEDECESDAPSYNCKICGKGFFHESAVRGKYFKFSMFKFKFFF